MTQHCNFPPIILDGYTQHAYIAEVEGLHPECRFTFRPILPSDRAVILGQQVRVDDRKCEAIAAQAIESYVKSWSLTQWKVEGESAVDTGDSLPIKADNILRLRPALLTKIFRIVIGESGGDAEPNSSPEADADDECSLAAALAGSSVEQHEAKN